MDLKGLLAVVGFFGLVPGGILLAYAGYWYQLYPYQAIPLVFGLVFVVAIVGLFVLIAAVGDRGG